MLKKIAIILVAGWLVGGNVIAQEAQKAPVIDSRMGPVIENFGPVLEVPEGSYELKKGVKYKTSMDVSDSAEVEGELNPHFVAAARYLNMNAGSGIDVADMEFALVVHGKAVNDLLTDEVHQSKFNRPNPNTALLDAIRSAGVKIYLCGQSSGFQGYSIEQMNPAVTMAISAMSAHVRLQSDGFTVIPF